MRSKFFIVSVPRKLLNTENVICLLYTSEAAAKEALVDCYPRDRYLLATKLPAWAGAKSKEEAEQPLLR